MKHSNNTLLGLLCIYLFFGAAAEASAQSSHRLNFGFGANFSTISIRSDDPLLDENPYTSRSGISFDYGYTYSKNLLSLAMGVGYTQLGASQVLSEFLSDGPNSLRIEGTLNFRYNYLYLAPMIGLNLDALAKNPGWFHARIGVGPWVGFSFGGTEEVDLTITETTLTTMTVTRETETRTIEVGSESIDQVLPVNLGVQYSLRLEIDVSPRFGIYTDLRYFYGTVDTTPDPSIFFGSPDVDILLRNFTVGAGLSLRL